MSVVPGVGRRERRIPASEVAFESTFDALPEFRFEVEPVVESDEEAVTPPVWVGGAPREAMESAFADDPTVEAAELVSAANGRWLYRIEWASHMSILIDILLVGGGTLLDAFGVNGDWRFRLLHADAQSLRETLDNCRARDVTFDVEQVIELAVDGADAETGAGETLVDGADGADVAVASDLDDATRVLTRESDRLSGDRTESTRSILESHVDGRSEKPG